jgi:hypothetical protein
MYEVGGCVVPERTQDGFLEFLYQLPSKLNPGRQGIRVVRDHLQALVEQKVLPNLSDADTTRVFPLGFSPAESDLKVAAGVGLERGYITAQEYDAALRSDKSASPFGFLQTLSGKVYGETVAPQIAQYWIGGNGDTFTKMPSGALYDFRWQPADRGQLIRVEMKASTEENPNFQQIRHPKMTNLDAKDFEYDILLCLHASNAGLEWWVFPAAEVQARIEDGSFPPQHGGQKMESGTYWVRMEAKNRLRYAAFQTTSEHLCAFILRFSR